MTMTMLYTCTRPPLRLPLRRFICRSAAAPGVAAYKEAFARRMAMAGIEPHHRIAMGVSGGPDSVALCVLAAGWKRDALAPREESSAVVDGLLGIVVDHGLRAESAEEAVLVRNRVSKMGIMCEIRCCDWPEGRPKQGQMQEAAREMRYEIFQRVCMEQHIGILLIAHHADDQDELFILRLSRGSGVLGLAGMAFISQLFPRDACYFKDDPREYGILLVRPLLKFSKVDMYKICEGACQEWVEDPTNKNKLFARNRIRCSLKAISSYPFKSEMQALISECQLTRSYVEDICRRMIYQSVTITDHGYAVIHLDKLEPANVEDLCLSRFIALVLQFISQRNAPVRSSVLSLVLNYIRGAPCKTSVTAAGCYISPAPTSKGMRIVVCHSFDKTTLSKIRSPYLYLKDPLCLPSREIEVIIMKAKSHTDQLLQRATRVPFLSSESPEAILAEARKLNLISESTFQSVVSLQLEEAKNFIKKTEIGHSYCPGFARKLENFSSVRLLPGQLCHFMGRLLVYWELVEADGESVFPSMLDCPQVSGGSETCVCSFCLLSQNSTVVVRLMTDSDWLHLAEVSKGCKMECQTTGNQYSAYLQLSATKALRALKFIPVCVRRTLPVFINSSNYVISIPSIGFKCCPHFSAVALFLPRVPLGGGYTSYI